MGSVSLIATNENNNLLLLAFCMSRLGVPPWEGQGQGGGGGWWGVGVGDTNQVKQDSPDSSS